MNPIPPNQYGAYPNYPVQEQSPGYTAYPYPTAPVEMPNISKLEIGQTSTNPWDGYNIILAVDISGSMEEAVDTNDPNTGSRMNFVKFKIKEFAKKALKYDKDGIDLFTFSTNVSEKMTISKFEDVERIFKDIEPHGITNTLDVIQACFDLHNSYLLVGKNKGSVVIVMTDGNPTRSVNRKAEDDSDRVEAKIIEISKLVRDDKEIGYSFLQVGHDKHATQFLKKLDNLKDPQTGKRLVNDIVDTKSFHDMSDENEPLTIEKILEKAING